MATRRTSSTRFVLFLHGSYAKTDLPFYRGFCRGKKLVAVDGGYSFFQKARLRPHVLIGDFDSIRAMPTDLTGIEVIAHPRAKDQTDGELGLTYCLGHGVRSIDIVQPSFGEPDQFLGNLMLLALAVRPERNRKVTVRVVSRDYEIRLLQDEELLVRDSVGDRVSIIPISRSITYGCSGTEFCCQARRIRLGESLAMRNTITNRSALFAVRGAALIVRQSGATRRKV